MKKTWLIFLFAWLASQLCALQPDAVVALDGSGDYTSIEDAIYGAREKVEGEPRWIILVKPGVYRERVYVQRERGNIALIGEDVETTILVNDFSANLEDKDGEKIGTFRTQTMHLDGDGLIIENMTISNDAGRVGQALALRIDADQVVLRNCRLLGWQDTLLVNRGRHYFEDCYIEGAVDYIFGGATAVFKGCTLHSVGNGYITAASTPYDQEHGLVFIDCQITGAEGVQTYLGRPWRAHAQTTFINTEMSETVRPEGWHNWGKKQREETTRYAEYGSTGPGGDLTQRVDWAKQLKKREASKLTPAKIFGDWDIPAKVSE
ncbi:MAG: pectinesterase family protein [Verrucomicrobiota bacterium JB022]|nr:pectinesterase family protein [Verrucomicrobiota bacterium JB022]